MTGIYIIWHKRHFCLLFFNKIILNFRAFLVSNSFLQVENNALWKMKIIFFQIEIEEGFKNIIHVCNFWAQIFIILFILIKPPM